MTGRVGRIGFFYVNGVTTTDGHGSDATQTIQDIIHSTPDKDPTESVVTFHRNDSAPTARMVSDLVLAAGGLAGLGWSIKKESENKGSTSSRIAGALGVVAIGGALYDYASMQEDKNTIAQALAERILKFLSQDHSRKVNLVLHSQGADIGSRALRQLSDHHKQRIQVITLGGMVTIADDACAQVHNFRFCNDLVANVLAAPFQAIMSAVDGDGTVATLEGGEELNCHGVAEYLQHEEVQKALQNLLYTS